MEGPPASPASSTGRWSISATSNEVIATGKTTLEDVAWCISPLWRGGTPFASGLTSPEEFVERWAEASGRAPDAERLHFYGVLCIVKMIAIMLTGLRAFRDGRTTDLRMAIFDHQLPYLYLLLGMTRGWLGA